MKPQDPNPWASFDRAVEERIRATKEQQARGDRRMNMILCCTVALFFFPFILAYITAYLDAAAPQPEVINDR